MTPANLASDVPAVPSTIARPPLITRPLLLRFVSIIGSTVSFFLPLSVVPMYARTSGSDTGAGFATGALLLATVAVELITPRLIDRLGYRLCLTLGLLLLGAPALVFLVSSDTRVIVAVSVVRGAGFAIATVAGGALTVSLIPAERRGEGLGLVGVVSGVPSLLALPLGVWAATHWGFGPVFAVTAAAALLALAAVPGLPGPQITRGRAPSVASGLTDPHLTRPATVFAASAVAAGVLVTFLPLATAAGSATVVTIALFAQSSAATLARWAAGRAGDRYGHGRLLVPGVVLSAAGMAAVAAVHTPALVIAGAAGFGVGFGLLQNATLTLMYTRVSSSRYGMVSAIWNAAYDAGMGAGAIGVGILVPHTGYPAAFLVTALLVLPALLVVRPGRGQDGDASSRYGRLGSR